MSTSSNELVLAGIVDGSRHIILRHRTLVQSFSKTAPKSLFWAPICEQDLSTHHDWPVIKAIVDLLMR